MHPAATELSTRLLSQVRSEFDRLRWQSQPIGARLLHRATNAEAEGVHGIPMDPNESVAMQGAGHRDGGQRFDEHGNPLFRADPILDVNGRPITNSAGEAFDIVMPAFRSVVFSGRVEDFQLLAGIAERAGRVAANLTNIPIFESLAGWRFSTPKDLWWALLFEIGWSGQHPLLVAERRLWLPAEEPNSFVPYDLQQLNRLAEAGFGVQTRIPSNWLKRLPDAWVSELDNVTAACVDTADYLLSALVPEQDGGSHAKSVEGGLEDNGSPPVSITRRFAVALSFPGERRDFVEEVARALGNALGDRRVFYDNWYQEELACPNLDLILTNFYREETDLVVAFLCKEYDEKEWCGLEWRAVRDLVKSRLRRDEDVMYLRFDKAEVDGMLSLDGYLDISRKNPREVADAILKRWTAKR